jgi:hypothetical protein
MVFISSVSIMSRLTGCRQRHAVRTSRSSQPWKKRRAWVPVSGSRAAIS